jgi:hypothetical protein
LPQKGFSFDAARRIYATTSPELFSEVEGGLETEPADFSGIPHKSPLNRAPYGYTPDGAFFVAPVALTTIARAC